MEVLTFSAPFNRTRLELKSADVSKHQQPFFTFNRTRLELKFVAWHFFGNYERPLIVPDWN